VAAGNNFNDAVIALISNSADLNAADSHGWTPMHIAVGNNYLIVFLTLLENPKT
jgi:ankyrin repeat protein